MHDDSSRKIGDGNAGLDASWYVEMPSSDVSARVMNGWVDSIVVGGNVVM